MSTGPNFLDPKHARDTTNVITHDEVKAQMVFSMILCCITEFIGAPAPLNVGQNIHLQSTPS
jgi:hypothetical protein